MKQVTESVTVERAAADSCIICMQTKLKRCKKMEPERLLFTHMLW